MQKCPRKNENAEETTVTNQPMSTQQWAFFLHLSQLLGLAAPVAGWVVPLVIWQMKKNELPGLDAHGKAVANWIISQLIYWAIALVLIFVVIGFVLVAVLAVVGVVFPIIGAIKANEGVAWKYPMTITFIR